jgi:hypothetical protein
MSMMEIIEMIQEDNPELSDEEIIRIADILINGTN